MGQPRSRPPISSLVDARSTVRSAPTATVTSETASSVTSAVPETAEPTEATGTTGTRKPIEPIPHSSHDPVSTPRPALAGLGRHAREDRLPLPCLQLAFPSPCPDRKWKQDQQPYECQNGQNRRHRVALVGLKGTPFEAVTVASHGVVPEHATFT